MFWRRGRIRYIIGGALVLLAVILLLNCSWRWTKPDEQPALNAVAQEWNATISRLGLEPVYPPQEDIVVGDIFLAITEDLGAERISETLAGRSLKLWHADLTKELKQTYQQTYLFPETPRDLKDGESAQAVAKGSIFDVPADRQTLPLVVLPGFTAARVREVSASGSVLTRWLEAIGVFEARGEKIIELKIPTAETYGVSAIEANEHLQSFCAEEKFKPVCRQEIARSALSSIVGEKVFDKVTIDGKTTYRLGVEILLVGRVYLARSIETVVHTASSFGAQAKATAQLSQKVEQLGKGSAPPGEPGEIKPSDDRIAALRRELAEQKARLQTAISQATGAPSGGNVAVQSSDDSRISVTQKLARPVAIAFRAIRMDLPE